MARLLDSSRIPRICSLFLFLATGSNIVFGQVSALTESTQALYRGDYTKASELAMAHLRKFPNDVPVRVILARAELAQAKFDEAFADLDRALTSDPRNIDALFYLSLIAREQSQKENQRLFSLTPDSDRIHQLLGEAAVAAGNQSQAEEEFGRALKANPHSVDALIDLAELKRSHQKFDEAIDDYTQAEQFGHLTYEIAYGLAACYTSKLDYPKAIEWLQKTVALAPDSAADRLALGNALFQNGQFEAAIQEFRASLQMEPRPIQAYFLLGRAYAKLGRAEEAKAAFQKFNELDRAEVRRKTKPNDAPRPEQP
jgi:tetratricopeptide (TPR) repeat protein